MTSTAAALFDVDGTLVDSSYLHTVTWWQALRQAGHLVPMARVHRAIGLGSAELLDHLLGVGRDRAGDGELDSAHQALYAVHWPSLEPLPGAAQVLRACAERGWTVVLATSAGAREVEVLRKVLDADDAIADQVHADQVDAAKPAPDLVEQALAQAGVDAGRAVFVGDTAWDVQAAHRAGVPCLGVLSGGWSRSELADAGAAQIYRDAGELAGFLDASLLADPASLNPGHAL
ncbi:HAD family hydrolase [Streptacidiphilus melanogenes]|uniref:HAD family hydrolase n=1 Tax=Streptacidiphilus melanogenes TaxID=411235 RepID=UPI0005AB2F68|nr:HAD family hydrolase [Streptacidiphilus melanogenes]